MNNIDICFCIDSNYTELAKICIASIVKHNPNSKFHILTECNNIYTLQSDNIRIYKTDYLKNVKLRFRSMSDPISRADYLKLCIPNILDLNKVLYLDVDMLCKKPLTDLWNMDTSFISGCETHSAGIKQAKQLGIQKYMNAGLLLMNLNSLRENDFTDKSLYNMLPNIPSSVWRHDETIINYLWNKNLQFLPQKFNVAINRKYINNINIKDAYIIHYIGDQKQLMIKDSKNEN